ncbi:MAG: hypothetical protein WCH46_06730 [bacterium]
MRFSVAVVLAIFASTVQSCAPSEKLDPTEMQYVKLTVALAKTRVFSRDTITLSRKIDSVFRVFHSTESAYKKQTTSLAEEPARSAIIFRAITDSLNAK